MLFEGFCLNLQGSSKILWFYIMSSPKKTQFSKRFTDLMNDIKKNISRLSKEIKNHPGDGLNWFLKNREHYDEIEKALGDLQQQSKSEQFTFDSLHKFFTQFNFREDDVAYAEWYLQAHNKIIELENNLDTKPLSAKLFRGLLNELRYISEDLEFHKTWGLTSLQQKVKTMYQTLLDKVDTVKKLTQESQQLEQKKLIVEEKRMELEKIKTQKEAIQLQKDKALIMKEKVEKDKELREIRRQQIAEEKALAELNEENRKKASEEKRRADLQDSYADLADKWDEQVSNSKG